MTKLLFVTSSSLAANPRLVKEFESFKHQYQCTVVCFSHQDWGSAISKEIIARNPEVQFHIIPYQQTLATKLTAKLLHKLAISINSFFKKSVWVAAHANSDKTVQLQNTLNNSLSPSDFDIVVVHTLGAFYPVLNLVNKSVKLVVDIEDYHLGEVAYFNVNNDMLNRKLVMQRVLNRANLVTYASPLIMKECFKEFENIKQLKQKSMVINNCFPAKEFKYEEHASKKVKFVWFSQNIAAGRGLEEILEALNDFSNQAELHLIGNLSPVFRKNHLQHYSSFVKLHSPKPQQNLHLDLAMYDIGLALEQGHCLNNNLALSNKIWAYLQAGLFIFATDTAAQNEFVQKHFNHGLIVKKNSNAVKLSLEKIITNIENIRKEKKNRLIFAREYSWENEFTKLKRFVYDFENQKNNY